MKAIVCCEKYTGAAHYCQVLLLAHLNIHLEDHFHFIKLPKNF